MTNRRLYALDHCTYQCSYHLVWTSKYRGRIMADRYIKEELKRIFKMVATWKGMVIRQWHVGDEHVHLYVEIPPKYSVAYAVCILKGKSSTWLKKKTKKIAKGSFWSRGYFVSTLGVNEWQVKKYIENQQHHQVEMPKLF